MPGGAVPPRDINERPLGRAFPIDNPDGSGHPHGSGIRGGRIAAGVGAPQRLATVVNSRNGTAGTSR
jgi:hypothetical protein